MTAQTESHGERAKRFRELAAAARLAAAKAEGEPQENFLRVEANWDRLAEEAEALVITYAAEIVQSQAEHKEAALKAPDEPHPQTEPKGEI